MTWTTFLNILFRWLHIIAACLAVGGAFFFRLLLPAAIASLDPVNRDAVFLRARRRFKMVVHPCILIFLISGAYNAWGNWGAYKLNPPLLHSLFGIHVLLALGVIGLLLWLLAGREPVRSNRSWMRGVLVLMFLTVLAASTLKWGRDRAIRQVHSTPTTLPTAASTLAAK